MRDELQIECRAQRAFAAMANVMHRAATVRRLGIHLIVALTLLAGCQSKKPGTFPFLQRFPPAPRTQTNLVQLQQDDGQWIMPAKDYASTRFSALNQINTETATLRFFTVSVLI